MPATSPDYKRLPGRGIRRRSVIAVTRNYCRLWEGPDHLLSVDSEGYTEDYKRFYYRDIQTLTVRKTDGGKYTNLLLGAPVLPLALITLAVHDPVGAGFLWGFAGLFLVALLVNWLRGPTCICHLRTAVQIEELPSLNRLRVANRVCGHLRTLIEQVQGPLPAPAAGTGGIAPAPSPIAVAGGTAAVSAKPTRHEHGTGHAVLFALLLGDALATGAAALHHDVWTMLVNLFLTVAMLVAIVMALIRQHESDMPGGLRAAVWTALGVYCVFFVIGYTRTITLTMEHPEAAGNQWELLKVIAAQSPLDSPFLLGLCLTSIGIDTALGVAGLVLLQKFRRDSETPPPLVGPTTGATHKPGEI